MQRSHASRAVAAVAIVVMLATHTHAGCQITPTVEGKVIIPDTVTSIDALSFQGCQTLVTLVIPDTVTTIGYAAFENCQSLQWVDISDSVTSMNEGNYDDDNDYDYNNNGPDNFCKCLGIGLFLTPSFVGRGLLECIPCYNRTTITIPDTVTSIFDNVFAGCSTVTTVVIGNSVTAIGIGAFEYLHSLVTVVIPDSVITIDAWAFAWCPNLTSIVIPDSVTSIGTSQTSLLCVNYGEASVNMILFVAQSCYCKHGIHANRSSTANNRDTRGSCV